MKTVPEPNEELLSAEDAMKDVETLESLLTKKKNKQKEDILENHSVREMLNELITKGICKSEEEAIKRALKTFMTAVIE